MEFIAKTEIEDGTVLVSFPDCPGCQTEGDDLADARVQAQEALVGWLETHLQEGLVPPRPAYKGKGIAVPVPVVLGLKLQLRWARADAGLTQGQLAKRLGVSQQMIAKLEHPDYEPSITRLEAAVKALGGELHADIAMGASIGAVIGAVLAGPAGAVAGAAFGSAMASKGGKKKAHRAAPRRHLTST